MVEQHPDIEALYTFIDEYSGTDLEGAVAQYVQDHPKVAGEVESTVMPVIQAVKAAYRRSQEQ